MAFAADRMLMPLAVTIAISFFLCDSVSLGIFDPCPLTRPRMLCYRVAMSTTTEPTISDLLAALRTVKDRKDAVNETLKQLNEWEQKHELAILAAMEQQGLTKHGDKVSSESGTFVRQTKWRAKYAPEKWPGIMAWCVANDRTDLIQRRTADSRVMELVDKGLPLPDGIEPESYTDCLFRRS